MSEPSLRDLLDGYRVTQTIHVAVRLGIPDLLATEPMTTAELAAATGSNEDALGRLLRSLASIGVLRDDGEHRFALTELGDPLRVDSPDSVAAWAAYIGREAHWRAWGDLLHGVRTGENAFRHVHGADVWRYRAEHPDEGVAFDRAMGALTSRENDAMLDAFDFDRFGTVVDVGGGNGSLIAAVLAATPAARGAVFDLPHVVARAPAVLEAAGVTDRCEVVTGSFFEDDLPPADAYVLRSILHDWEDEEATAILRACARSLRPGGSVLIVERTIGPPNADPAATLSDLNMLVGPGGRERTVEEYAALLEQAGLSLAGSTPVAAGRSVIEGVAG